MKRAYRQVEEEDTTPNPAPQPLRCPSCKQKLDSLTFYNGHPNNSNEEFISLTNETLLIFTGEEEDLPESDSRPTHKLTGYCVYDDHGHLTPFDTGLVEDNVVLRLSGYIKPIYMEDGSVDGGVPTHDMGPINAWYISGFDGGEKAYVGVITAYAEYILMEPSPEYLVVVTPFLKKVPLLKTILEFLMDSGWENPTYEDLLFHLQTCGNVDFDEEFLLENSGFICKQVFNFEDAAPDEEPLMRVPCMKTLVELSGVVLKKSKSRVSKRNLRTTVERKATTTKLVKAIFENFFPHQIEEKDGKILKKKRCGICDSCQTPDCGTCAHCKDMVKFGGSGKTKQACKLRRCPNMEPEDTDDSEEEESQTQTKKFSYRQVTNKIQWLEEPLLVEDEKKFYRSALVGTTIVTPEDFVLLNPDTPNKPLIIAKIISLFSKYNQPTFHAQIYYRGIDTMLGETANPQELFVVDVCEDCPLGSIVDKAQVTLKAIPDDWSHLGGLQTLDVPNDDNKFFINKRYDTETARFSDFVVEELDGECPCCRRRSRQRQFDSRILEGDRVLWRDQFYGVGSSIFLKPSVYRFNTSRSSSSQEKEMVAIDEEMYPERYRKGLDTNTVEDITEPFCVALIEDLYSTKKSNDIKIKARIFYRPENTKNSVFLAHEKDLNLLYWTDEVVTTSFNNVTGKCYVTYCEPSEALEWSNKGPLRFYFNEGYNSKTFDYFDVPKPALSIGYFGKGKGKGKTKCVTFADPPPEWEQIGRPLRCMDLFAGCGGLSLGLHQSGVAETKWAIEIMNKPAEAFKINIHDCKVFTEDCNKILKEILAEKKHLPKKGDVEILVGGPPCQGFSNMNRFSARQYSLLKNSLIVTLLSFCDYYRPQIFVLENVRHFAFFKRSMVLKLTVRCLLEIGYQVTFGVLQAAHYGLPQTRRRFILLAVAPGYVLPRLPSPLHVFEKKDYHLSVTIDGVKYYKDGFWEESAPYRSICVRDAISDLPPISNGHNNEKMAYDDGPVSHFQRKMRGGNVVLYDHICKDMAPVVEARILYIPCVPGSDWRDLPNICVKLRDNTMTNKLEYPYYSKKQTKFGKPRAICQCGTGKSCNPLDRQLNTLIPWCLPHTADRHNNWAGLYGRLGWDEVFRTTVTNPEPIGKQGKGKGSCVNTHFIKIVVVIHPEQHRVVSVRECARSQGFPDHFRFFGNILDKHRQIGNAVPPPLGQAIGLELRKTVALARKS